MVDYKADKEKMISDWWKSSLGQHVLEQERALLQSLSQHFYGDYQVQLGIEQALLPSTPV